MSHFSRRKTVNEQHSPSMRRMGTCEELKASCCFETERSSSGGAGAMVILAREATQALLENGDQSRPARGIPRIQEPG